jgi:NADH-quinone oxidoreductase subunit L
MERAWGVDAAYSAVIVGGYQRLAEFVANPVDLGVIDALGAGIGALTRGLSGGLRKVQNGFVRSYALMMLLGVAVFLGYLLFIR